MIKPIKAETQKLWLRLWRGMKNATRSNK